MLRRALSFVLLAALSAAAQTHTPPKCKPPRSGAPAACPAPPTAAGGWTQQLPLLFDINWPYDTLDKCTAPPADGTECTRYSVDANGQLKKPPTLWQGNPAASSLLFRRPELLPLRVEKIEYLEFLSYPLSGGFSYRSLLPAWLLRAMHRIEQSPLIANQYLGVRMLVVMTKKG